MKEYFAIYHRPTDTWSTWNVTSFHGFLSQDKAMPRTFDSQEGCKRALTFFVQHCKKHFPQHLEFCLGLEVVRIAALFSLIEVKHKQLFSIDKI